MFAARRLCESASRRAVSSRSRLAASSVSLRTSSPELQQLQQQPFNGVSRVFSSYSSFSEPDPTLFMGTSLHDAPDALDGDKSKVKPSHATRDKDDAQLRADIRVMGSLLGKVIRQHDGEDMFHKVEDMRALAKTWREEGAGRKESADAETAFGDLVAYASKLSNEELFKVSRAFTHFLAIANAAEGHHRSRRLNLSKQETSCGALYPKPDSCGGVLPALLEKGHSAEAIWEALSTQQTELVLTAHPTEVNRRTILGKHRRIQNILTEADAIRLTGATAYRQAQLDQSLEREITSIWLSDEVSRVKPTPEKEAEKGTLVLETVLWGALPGFLRKLDETSKEFLGKGLPLDAAPIKFASWMGGDRDGNPNVTPRTTREVCLRNRAKAATLFATDLENLELELSLTTCNDELRAIVGDAREPYRAFLRPIIEKLRLTVKWAEQELDFLHKVQTASHHTDAVEVEDIYISKKEFTDELLLAHRSLCETGNELAADGMLTDVLRNVSAFGLTLIPLDVRQESDRHEEALDAITRFLGKGSYAQWDEETRISWMTKEISSTRPLLRAGVWHDYPEVFSPTTVDTLETFRMISEQHEDSLGAYVISQATNASDILAVLLLQRDAGVKKPLRVAPLFETLDDLNGAAATMRSLFSTPVYMGLIEGKQEVMIGYSDSAKDAGRLAASWAQYEKQEELAQVARDFSVDMTFFHGKGGTVGRGGNPQTFHAIMSHAPDTINGKFRVTEQGEMINQNFGYDDRATRTMDIYTAAILAEKLTKRPKPPQVWRDMMNKLSDRSVEAYRKIVFKDERFVSYFRAATPELELSNLNIGSRPAKRKASGGVESLRAIPWIFAWTQTRFNLPIWLGVGEALGEVLEKDEEDAVVLKEMYRDWDSFRTMIDLVEMVLAKSEPSIAKHYDDVLVKDEKAKELGVEVRNIHLATERTILSLTEHEQLSENNKILLRALLVRNPYVDCLNVLQAETLKRLREQEEGKDDLVLKDALLTTITGIANGMGNTG
jgi:phosphoenolpyruvate carboxylase